jgi:hypothetical protein
MEGQALQSQLQNLQTQKASIPDKIREFLELANNACLLYESSFPAEKREMLRRITSNRIVREKTPVITLDSAFQVLANRSKYQNGGPSRSIHRTWEDLVAVFIGSAVMSLDVAV